MTTWSTTDISAGMTLSNGNLTATSTNTSNKGVRSTGSKSTGKYYVEFTITGTLGGADTGMGIATSSAVLTSIGAAAAGGAVIFAGTGNIYFNGTFTGVSTGGSTGVGTVWGMAVDLVNSRIWWRINNGNWNGNVANNPASNVGGINIVGLFPSNAAFVLFCANFTSAGIGINFGASAYSFTPPTGFSSWDPVVTPGNFSIVLPLITGQAVGTMVATNSPTTWSFTAGNVGGFYAIDNSGAITVTAAGAAGLTIGSEVLTVQACNGTPATFDPATAFHATLSNGNLTATAVAPANGSASMFASLGQTSGKYYFEITWATMGGFLNGGGIGIATTTATNFDIISHAADTVQLTQGNFFDGGPIWSGGVETGFRLGGTGLLGPYLAAGFVIGIAVDLDNRTAWFKVASPSFLSNFWNGVSTANPATNTGGVAVPAGTIIPAVGWGLNLDQYVANFGASAFVGTVPSGFSAWPSTLACGTAPATIDVVANAPVVNSTSFTDFLPVSTTELVGVVTASNFPTSWSIIAGDPSGFYAIDNNGAITITSAGDAGIVAGIVTLTVRASNAGGSGTGSVQITTVAEAVAQYRLLVPHYLASGYTVAGTTVTEGVEIPSGWVPTIAVEPLNITAIHNYWNAGPPAGAEYGEDFFIFPVAQKPSVYWQPLGPLGYFQLTGAGATFGARTSG